MGVTIEPPVPSWKYVFKQAMSLLIRKDTQHKSKIPKLVVHY